MTTGVGSLLRDWRSRRRFSQLDLALTAGVSARHLSFVETGRSQASRELLLALAEALDVPLRERNTLLLAAGYAPTYPASDLGSDALREVRAALEHLLAGHEPFPALVVDRYGDVQLANRAVPVLLAADDAPNGANPAGKSPGSDDPSGDDPIAGGADGNRPPADRIPEIAAELLRPPINIYRLSLHPHGLAPRIRNLPDWSTHLLDQLARQAHLTADPRLADLLTEVRAYPAARHARDHHPPGHGVLLALHLDHPAGRLHLHSTITHFGAPHDVTLAELAVESFFPADDATRRVLSRALTPP